MDFPAAGYVGRWLPGNMGTDEEKNHGPSFNLDMLKDPVPWREIKHDYTTVSEAVIIPLIPWCSISLLEDHCLIHFLTGTSIECDLDTSSVQQSPPEDISEAACERACWGKIENAGNEVPLIRHFRELFPSSQIITVKNAPGITRVTSTQYITCLMSGIRKLKHSSSLAKRNGLIKVTSQLCFW